MIIPDAEVQKISLGLMTDEDILDISVGRIEPDPSTRKSQVSSNSILDPRMGTITNSVVCSTCGRNADTCGGHSMHLDLPLPMLNGVLLPLAHKILTCVCFRCSALLIPRGHPKLRKLQDLKGNHRKLLNELHALALRHRVCLPPEAREDHDGSMLGPEEALAAGHCGAVQPAYWKRHNVVVVRPVFDVAVEEDVPAVTMHDVYEIFRNISARDQETLGFRPDKGSSTASACSKVFIVPPVLMRPSRSSFSEDDLSARLRQIFTLVRSWDPAQAGSGNLSMWRGTAAADATGSVDAAGGEEERELEETEPAHTKESRGKCSKNKKPLVPACLSAYFELQRFVAGFVDSRLNLMLDYDYGKNRQSVRERFVSGKAKTGRIRGTISGKRGDFSARGVASPNNRIDPDQVGLPLMMCMKLTYEEVVTPYNYDALFRTVQNGPDVYPGANYLRRGGDTFELPRFMAGGLQLGDVVLRHLVADDLVLVNRQPTLHRYSLLAYRVHPVPDKTIQIHLSMTVPLNADFDGDELNVFSLYSVEARAEAQEVMSVEQNLFKDGSIIVGFVQHACLAMYCLTKRDLPLDRDRVVQILMAGNNDAFLREALLPESASGGPWTTRRLAAGVLPNYDPTTGSLTKGRFNRLFSLLAQGAWKSGVCRRIGFLVRLLQEYVYLVGPTMGLDDCTVPPLPAASRDHLRRKVADMDRLIILKDREPNHGLRQVLEENICELSDGVRACPGDHALAELKDRSESGGPGSWLYDIIESGAKGNMTHIVQNVACVGQQLDHTSRRPLELRSHGTASRSRQGGLVQSSFVRGLDPVEFFHHLSASRQGLVSTAVSTSETGYIYRCISKCLEDLRTQFNTAVVDADANIVLPCFGFSTDRLQLVRIRFLDLSAAEIDVQYGAPGSDAARELAHLHFLRDSILDQKYVHRSVHVPLDFLALLAERRCRPPRVPAADSEAAATVDPDFIRARVARTWVHLVGRCRVPDNLYVEAVFFDYLSTSSLWPVIRDAADLEDVLGYVSDRLAENVIETGSAIGLISSQSFSEPLTQLNLNSFHHSGQGGKLTGGVGRIKEILNLSKAIGTPSMKIFACRGETLDGISFVQLRLVDVARGWSDPTDDPGAGLVAVTLVLDKEKLIERRISPREIREHVLSAPYLRRVPADGVTCSGLGEDTWWVTIRGPETIVARDLGAVPAKNGRQHHHNRQSVVSRLGFLLCHDTRIFRGIRGITDFYASTQEVNDVVDDRLVKVRRQVITTLGSNLVDVCLVPGVDVRLTTTNDIPEIYSCYGVDAATKAIEEELASVMVANSASVSRRHITLIAQLMTRTGAPCALTFAGMQNSCTSKLKLAGFERTLDSFIAAATMGHSDRLQGISESLLVGNRISVGTGGAFDVVSGAIGPNVQTPGELVRSVRGFRKQKTVCPPAGRGRLPSRVLPMGNRSLGGRILARVLLPSFRERPAPPPPSSNGPRVRPGGGGRPTGKRKYKPRTSDEGPPEAKSGKYTRARGSGTTTTEARPEVGTTMYQVSNGPVRRGFGRYYPAGDQRGAMVPYSPTVSIRRIGALRLPWSHRPVADRPEVTKK